MQGLYHVVIVLDPTQTPPTPERGGCDRRLLRIPHRIRFASGIPAALSYGCIRVISCRKHGVPCLSLEPGSRDMSLYTHEFTPSYLTNPLPIVKDCTFSRNVWQKAR